MTKWLRRLFWLGLLGGAGFAVWTALQRRNEPAPSAPAAPTAPDRPKVAPPAFTEVAEVTEDAQDAQGAQATGVADDSSAAGQRWAAAVDGSCPAGYTIKVSAKSAIYHVPGGRFYDRTVADRCYASAEDAEADGYRRAKA